MADSLFSFQNLKDFLSSQIEDEKKWDFNKRLLGAVGLFTGSIFVMRNYGDVMAV